jgi:hypothetical protein
MSKKFNTEELDKELGSSLFFTNTPKTEPTKKLAKTVRPVRAPRTNGGDATNSNVINMYESEIEAKKSKARRIRVRYAYEFYEDQLQSIDDVTHALRVKLNMNISKSDLVRKILDNGLNELKEKLNI